MADGVDLPRTERSTSAATATGVHLPRVRALDGLRGVAVLAVLLFHDQRLRGGYLGVDLFFVLSGYLITSLLLVERRDRGRVRLGRFYERRARRLLPAMGLALVFVAIYAAIWADPSELPRIRWDGIATLFYFANWRDIFTKQDYWNIFRAPSALQHTWSLSIEEQFYALWPLIVFAVATTRRSARAVLGVALALGTAGAVFTVVGAMHDGNPRLFYFGTASRAPALLMGAALAAVITERGPFRSRRTRVALEMAAIVSAGYLAFEWTHQQGEGLTLYRGPLLLCGLAATVVIASASHPERGLIARVLAFPPLVGAGLISYGLYLYHWPMYLVLTRARTGLSGWSLLGTRVAASTALAIASYVLLEQPIRTGALRPARAMTAFATLAAATTVVIAALVITTHVPVPAISVPTPSFVSARPWPRPTPPIIPGTDVRRFLPPGDWSRLTNTCELGPGPPPVRSVGRTTQPKVLLVGDSVGCFIGAALDERQISDGVVTLNRSRLGCPLRAARRERDASGATTTQRFRACVDGARSAIVTFKPDVSVLLVGGPMVNEYDIGTGRFVGACDAAFAPWYRAGARHSIDVLSATGAPVVVVSIVHTPDFIDIGPGISVPDAYGRAVDCLNRWLRQVVDSEPSARYLDLDAYICPHGKCLTKLDGETLRGDGRHFQGPAANIVAAWLLPRVIDAVGRHF